MGSKALRAVFAMGAWIFLGVTANTTASPIRTPPQPPGRQSAPTPPAAKIERQVRDAIGRLAAERIRADLPPADVRTRFSGPLVRVDDHARLQLYIHLQTADESSVAALHHAADLVVEIVNPDLRIVQAWAPYDQIEALAALDSVTRIRPPEYTVCQTGSVTSQGDSILRANLVRSTYNITGSGVRVGVISDGANNTSSSQATGDLPASITVFGSCSSAVTGTTCNEGTAMMEIVHDLAPDATLAMGDTATSLDFVQRVTDLTNWGANVIVDDLSDFGQPYFEDGSMASAYANALAHGVVMVSAAGNYAGNHYQGVYSNPSGDGWHDFGGGDETMQFTVNPGRSAAIFLQWSNPFGGSSDDYDLYIWDSTVTNVVASSTNSQSGFDDPYEETVVSCDSASPCTFYAAIYRYFANVQTLEMFILGGTPTNHVVSSDSIFGHTAVPGVISVAAISASNPGTLTIEPYSSLGPSTVFFPSYQQRATPAITTVDCVSDTGAGGFPTTFCGTSAAAPHAAAIAALLLQAKSGMTPAQVESAIQSTAADRGSSGYDFTYGSGLADAYAAVTSVMPGPQTLTVSRTGAGSGTVASSPAGINCGATCQASFSYNTHVTLTATAGSGSQFTAWSGACAGSLTQCTVTMSQAWSVSANFGIAPQQLAVTKAGTGTGAVTSSPAGINCGTTCVANFSYNTLVTLSAAAGSQSTFSGWSGEGCGGTGTCQVTMSQARNVTATFTGTVVTGFYTVTPCRLIDTRNAVGPYGGPSLNAGLVRNVIAVGQCSIPSGVKSLSVNLTAVNASSDGWLTLSPGPSGAAVPFVSTLNYRSGRILANNAIVPVAADGSINVYNSGPFGINFIIDVNGYFQ